MKKIFFFISLIINIIVLYSQPGSSVDGIIAVVGKEIIMKSDIEIDYADYMNRVIDVDDEYQTKCEIFEHLLMNKLLIHQADLDSIVVTDQQVDDRINYTILYILQEVGGDTKMIEEYYNKTMDEIKKDMRENIYNQMIIEQVQQSITANITITPSEVKQFTQRIPIDSMPIIKTTYEFGHIVKIPPVSEAEIDDIKIRLNDYRERSLRGEKFSILARLYSDDPGSASKGGDLGFVERGSLYPEFEAVAFKLKTGEISEIVKTQAGYHIIQMIERRGEQIHIAHILIQPKPSTDEQVKAIEYLDSVRKVIEDEKLEFSQAALKFSDDPNKNSGGWVINSYTNSYKFERDAIEPSTLVTIDKLIQGEYSQCVPFITEDGLVAYRLIYLKSKVLEHKPNLVEDYDVIQNAALEEKKMNALNKWVLNKVKFTSIKIADDYKDCPFIQDWKIPNL